MWRVFTLLFFVLEYFVTISFTTMSCILLIFSRFLAELFTTAMLFKWKGERTKSHEK